MKTGDKKAYGHKFREAPLPRRWCGNNWHHDAGQQHGPNPVHGQGSKSAFATTPRSSWEPQSVRRHRGAPLLQLVSWLIGEFSKTFPLDQRSRANYFADAANDMFDLVFC
jgi:hypothetical protein